MKKDSHHLLWKSMTTKQMSRESATVPLREEPDEPARKLMKKEETAKVLLDDLFRKTKATPSIYWLPLTADQIAGKEALCRKHMAEHKKMLEEQRKKREARRSRRSRSPKR